MTSKEKFLAWFDEQVAAGMKNFRPSFNKAEIAKHFGAKLVEDPNFPFIDYIDFSGTEYSIDHPEVEEYIYSALLQLTEAMKNSIRISNATDRYGKVLDPNHPDWMTVEERVQRLKLWPEITKTPYSLVLEGHIGLEDSPWETMEEAEEAFTAYKVDYESRTGMTWRHPVVDNV